MEKDEIDAESVIVNVSGEETQALNATILDYYRKFGKKRDLEQYFSLSTAQGELGDPTSLFWRRMKAQPDSSDSGEKSRDSSLEVCRISIKCSVPDTDATTSQSQDDNPKTKESESPPIIIEELPADRSRHSDDESVKSDDNNSQKSMDVMLDTSINKAFSPTSSITSQRKLEWDSLADVGYANESDKANTASSLSTLERLALKQQYSNNDTKQDSLGIPTAHSTPVDENDSKNKGKKGKTTRIYRKDVDLVEVNMPHTSDGNPSQSINVNLTKHISFNVEKDGGVSVGNVKRDLMVIPEKDPTEPEFSSQMKLDKEIQTSLIKNKVGFESPRHLQLYGNSVPVLINLNSLKKRNRKKKLKTARRRLRMKKKIEANKENLPVLEKSGEQVSEAESFEYMPGHIYNQNQMNQEPLRSSTVDNKSSLESSAAVTTDSSKDSKHSFTRDLEKSIKLLKTTLSRHYNDSDLKKKLIKDVVQRLLQNRYRDDETTTEFLSGLSFNSKKLGLRGDTTTSTSDANNTAEKPKPMRPKKSILRNDKFNTNAVASTSQSVPNLPSVSKSEKPVSSKLSHIYSHTESDVSSKEKHSSDTAFGKTSSEELYLKYLDALKREEAYKKHLREKELFLKQRLVSSDMVFNVPAKLDSKSQVKLKELMKDLTRNNYDDGSGDASKLEGGPTNMDNVRYPVPRAQRSHSVFTLSSDASDHKKPAKKEEHRDSAKPGHSRAEQHYCCCPLHFENRLGVTDSSVQVNIGDDGKNVCGICDGKTNCKIGTLKGCECNQKSGRAGATTCFVSNDSGDIKYVCVCNAHKIQKANDNLLIYKCSRLNNRSVQSHPHNSAGTSKKTAIEEMLTAKACKCSQTNLKLKLPDEDYQETVCIHEAVRCIQTDISIDPKISDPSLTDIKIMKHSDCVRLIREQFREVSKSVSDEQAGPSRSLRTQEKTKELIQSPRQSIHTGVQFDANMLKSGGEKDGNFIDIPIQGTNMTLKVSVGSNGANPSQKTHYVQVDEAKEREQRRSSDTSRPHTPRDGKRSPGTSRPHTPRDGKRSPGTSRPHTPRDGKQCSPVKKPMNTAETSTQVGVRKKHESCDSSRDNRKERSDEKSSKISEYKPVSLSSTGQAPSPEYSQNEDNLSDIDRRRELFDTIFKRDENSNVPNRAATSKPIKKPFLRTNTDPQISEKSVDAQRDLLDKIFARQQVSSDTMTDDVKKQEPKKTSYKYGTYPKGEEQIPGDRTDDVKKQEPKKTSYKSGTYSKGEEQIPGDRTDDVKKQEPKKTSYKSGTYSKGEEQIPGDRTDDVKKQEPKKTSYKSGTYSKGEEPKPGDRMDDVKKQEPKKTSYKSSTYSKGEEPKPGDRTDDVKKQEPKKTSYKSSTYPIGEEPKPGDRMDDVKKQEPKKTSYKSSTYPKDEEHEPSDRFSSSLRTERRNSPDITDRDNRYSPRRTDRFDKEEEENSSADKFEINSHSSPRKSPQRIEKGEKCKPKSPRRKPVVGCGEGKDKRDIKVKKKEVLETESSESLVMISTDGATRTRCECAVTAVCGGFCLEDAPCRSKSKSDTEITATQSPNPSTEEVESERDQTSEEMSSDSKPPLRHMAALPPQIESPRKKSTEVRKIEMPQKYEPPNIQKPRPKLVETHSKPLDPSQKKIERQYDEIMLKYNDLEKKVEQPSKRVEQSSKKVELPTRRAGSPSVTIEKPTASKSPGHAPFSIKTKELQKEGTNKDIIMSLIQDITNRYSKKDVEKDQRKKCFKEIVSLLSYLLDTEDATDSETAKLIKGVLTDSTSSDNSSKKCCGNASGSRKPVESSSSGPICKESDEKTVASSFKKMKSVASLTEDTCRAHNECSCHRKRYVDRGVQQCTKRAKSRCYTESSDLPCSTEVPCTSSDSATCRVLNKIRKECEKYHQRRCKTGGKKCECSSTTSMSCHECKRVHHCLCRASKCKGYKTRTSEKFRKKCIAYNLIIQTSDSIVSEEPPSDKNFRPLKNIIVKVPPKPMNCSPRSEGRGHRSRSLPNETQITNMENGAETTVYTVRDYLERNRPEFIEQCTQRQNCLKMISETRANERAIKRELLSMQMQLGEPMLRALSEADLRSLARDLGVKMRRKKEPAKFISEREMKKHSEKIYKTLPEVVQKKEDLKKENIKKTNLLMASLFKKNLQKKTLRGNVNLSNYNPVIKI